MNISEERRQYHRYPVGHLSARITPSSDLTAEFPSSIFKPWILIVMALP